MAEQKYVTWLAGIAFLLVGLTPALGENHGLAMLGTPNLAENFDRFDYTAKAPVRGGRLVEAKIGSFDNLNPFTIRGTTAFDVRELVFESLLARNMNEPFTLYAQLAEQVAVTPDRSKMQIRLNPAARFSDGHPVRAQDVIFSWNSLRSSGRPNHRYYYDKVAQVEKSGDRDIIFSFKGPPYDNELPLIIGLMPILPEHVYQGRDLQASSFDLPVGSGPYIISEVEPGRRIVFRHDPQHWARTLPSLKNRYNFDELIHDYYRDEASAFEAFKAGRVDIWFETDALRWQSGFDFPAALDGRIIQETLPLRTPSGLNAFVLNTRRPLFADQRVRRALDLVFDFEWVNKTLYANAFVRSQSYFGGTDLSATGHPASAGEKALLREAKLSREDLQSSYQAPVSDGSGRDRNNRTLAMNLLADAGLTITDGFLKNADGQTVEFEILVQRRDHERLALAYQRMLKQVGITSHVRLVDAAQYQRRLQSFDFDVIIYDYYASLSPGNEQTYYWSRDAATTEGSRNYAGITSVAIDRAIAALTAARHNDQFREAARALDRGLMSGHYFIPLFHRPGQWVARWSYIQRPEMTPIYGAQIDSWWATPEN
jgi:peptide/nickel transport system substrate-binding protein